MCVDTPIHLNPECLKDWVCNESDSPKVPSSNSSESFKESSTSVNESVKEMSLEELNESLEEFCLSILLK